MANSRTEERNIDIFDEKEKSQRKDSKNKEKPDFEIMLKDKDETQLIVEVKKPLESIQKQSKVKRRDVKDEVK